MDFTIKQEITEFEYFDVIDRRLSNHFQEEEKKDWQEDEPETTELKIEIGDHVDNFLVSIKEEIEDKFLKVESVSVQDETSNNIADKKIGSDIKEIPTATCDSDLNEVRPFIILNNEPVAKVLNSLPLRCVNNCYVCGICTYKTKHLSTLKRHRMIHTGEKPYKCTLCEYRTQWKGGLKSHMKKHTGEKHLKCLFCEFKTGRRQNLERHVMTIHETERPFACKLCSYRAKRKEYMPSHMKSHNDGNLFKCDECDFITEFKRNLKGHAKTHNGEELLKCPDCEYRTKRRCALRKHQKTHSKQSR